MCFFPHFLNKENVMPIETITRRFEFDYGHRVLGHQGKCRFLHGHRGVALVEMKAASLNELGMFIDFSDAKQLIGTWIDLYWDHNMILHPDDPLVKANQEEECSDHNCTYSKAFKDGVFPPERPPYIMKRGNPTAELMARELFTAAYDIMRKEGIDVTKVTLYETPNSYATYTD